MVKAHILIIGGGPAGLAAAIATRRRGFNVTVADGIVPPADKACGEGLMPDALLALSKLGVSLSASDSFPFRGIRFMDRGASVDADFPASCGRGVRRTTLHRMMIEQAEAVGVRLRWGAKVDLSAMRCGWIIGADGENSLVRKWARLDVPVRDPPLRVSPPLSDRPNRLHGTILGPYLPGLRDAGHARLSLCRGDLARFAVPLSTSESIAKSCGVPSGWQGSCSRSAIMLSLGARRCPR